MAWRDDKAIQGAAAQKRDVVATPAPEYYLDIKTPLQQTYEFEPAPADMPAEQQKYVLGVQGNMWGQKFVQTLALVDKQIFPRLTAIAETGWTQRENRHFADFSSRLQRFPKRMKLLGVNVMASPATSNKKVKAMETE